MPLRPNTVLALVAATVLSIAPLHSRAIAEDIEISQYGVAPGGMPYAVAMAKGYFKEFGADVTGIRSSPGGAPTIRNLISGDLSYGEAGITAVLAANRSGADIKVIGGSINTVAEVFFVSMPGTTITSLQDLKGKRVGFTTPQSVTQMLAMMLLESAGLPATDVRLISTGGFPQALTALEHGGLDVAPIVEPTYTQSGDKYRTVVSAAQAFPPLSNVLGLTTARKAREKPEFLRGILAARRKAVEFMTTNTPESAAIIASTFKMDAALVEKVLRNLIEKGGSGTVTYYGRGDIPFEGIENMVRGQALIGGTTGPIDWSTLVDQSFLAADLRRTPPR